MQRFGGCCAFLFFWAEAPLPRASSAHYENPLSLYLTVPTLCRTQRLSTHRGNHQIESVRGARAMGRGIGQWIYNLQLLNEPGHPCVTMSGNAFSCFERT